MPRSSALLGLLLLGAAAPQDAKPATVRISLQVEEKRLNPDRAMPVRFTIENLTDQEIELDEPTDWLDGLEIVDDQNRKVKPSGANLTKARSVKVGPRGFIGRVVDIAPALKGQTFDEGTFKLVWRWGGVDSNEVRPVVMREWIATIETNFGAIKVMFYPDVAPRHVVNFLRLVRDKVYEDVRFYRVVPDFVIQGGPQGRTTMKGIPLEISERKHVFGALGMARGKAPDSATTEFYLCLKETPQLNGLYTVFGQTVDGEAVLTDIGKVKTADEKPAVDIIIKKITLSLKESK